MIEKNMFLVASKCDANEAITVLLKYMYTEGSFSDNIPKAAMEYTNFNQRKVQKLMKGMMSLITQGVKINLANTKLVYKKATYDQDEKRYEKKPQGSSRSY